MTTRANEREDPHGHAESEFRLKVLMMGPSRVGKTTLLTAVLADTRDQLAGTTVTMDPYDTATKKLVRANDQELQSELLSGEFTGQSLSGTEEITQYSFTIAPGVNGYGLGIDFLDFPGGLLDIDTQEQRPRDWHRVQEFGREAIAMVVPVDATVLMEAYLPDHRRQWSRLLGLREVQDAAVAWAKYRKEAEGEPALLVLAPVKCETYFADNGGHRDRSHELRKRVDEAYLELRTAVKNEYEGVRVLYGPVDSIGCVEVESVSWEGSGNRLAPRVTFMVRNPARRRIFGAESVLVPLVADVVKARRAAERELAKEKRENAGDAERERDRPRSFFQRVIGWVTGDQRRLRELANEANREAQKVADRLKQYDKALSKLANRRLGPRSAWIDTDGAPQ